MEITPAFYTASTGDIFLLRSLDPGEAELLRLHQRRTSAESHFMVRYPEECDPSSERLRDRLEELARHPVSFDLAAFRWERLVADLQVCQLPHRKTCHRAVLGISVQAAFCGLGLGRAMLAAAAVQARANGLTLLELGVLADNVRAIRLYKSLGFRPFGEQPGAFRLEDGTYRAEIGMQLWLSEVRTHA